MFYTFYSALIGGALFLAMLLLLEVGRRAGQRSASEDSSARTGLGAIDAAVFSLLGLLLAFSFSGAAARFDLRRQLAIQEANCISTAWLRIDLLSAEARPQLRERFRQYLDSRLRVAQKMPDLVAAREELFACDQLQRAIWAEALVGCAASASHAPTMLLLPALNQMFDIATSRTAAAQIHPPLIIFTMLFLLSLASALLAGHGMSAAKKRSWLHIVGLAAAVAVAVLVIVDLEYPRAGFIRLDSVDQILVDLRRTMDKP